MAEFPPNLDDGELWPPSDIFLNEVPFTSKLHPHPFSPMDDLAHHFAALSFLQKHQSQSLPNPLLPLQGLQRFRPPVRSAHFDFPLPQSYLGLNHGLESKGPTFHGFGTEQLHYHYQFLKPAQLQVDGSFLETRNGFLKRQQNRLLPYQASGIGSMGGFERVSGGTGVFHPRVLNSSTTVNNPVVRRKQGLRNSEEVKAIQQRNSINHQLRSDVGLPQDWTY